MPTARPQRTRTAGQGRTAGAGRRRRPATRREHQPLRGDGARQAGHVAQRPERREPEQRRADGHDHRPPRQPAVVLDEPAEQTRTAAGSAARRRARSSSASAARLRAARRRQRRSTAVEAFAERDEDRIAGRMRLMLGDVEVAHAEREVDRVDVFERRRQEERGARARNSDARAPRRLCSLADADQTGRRRSASFRLPRR